MKSVHAYLSTTTSQERLNSLALLSIDRENCWADWL